MEMECETCWYNEYDEEMDEYYCMQIVDEDVYARLVQNPKQRCPYWRDGNEYTVARKQ